MSEVVLDEANASQKAMHSGTGIEREENMGELVFLALALAVCGVLYGMSFDFKTSVLDTSGGAAFWPRIVIVFLACFIIFRGIQVIKNKDNRQFVFGELFRGSRLFFLLSLTGYIVLFKYVGYLVSTMLFLLITVNVFYKITRDNFGSVRSIVTRNAVVVAFAFGCYFFFAKVVHIALPQDTIWSGIVG